MKLEFQPCINGNEQSSDPNLKYYPLELHSSCKLDPYLNVTTDTRYTSISSFIVSQYDLETRSGVSTKLNALPMHSSFAQSDTSKQ